jgi:hypothetical protein
MFCNIDYGSNRSLTGRRIHHQAAKLVNPNPDRNAA